MRVLMSACLPAPSTIVRGVLVDGDLLGPAQVLQREVLQLQAQVLADQRAAGQHGDVAQHRLAAIAEAGGLDRADRSARRGAC